MEFFELSPEDEALYRIADEALFRHTGRRMTDVERYVLQGSLQGLTYGAIANITSYAVNTLTGDVGAKLWQKLTDAFGEKISKRDCRSVLTHIQRMLQMHGQDGEAFVLPEKSEELYVTRSPIERNALSALMKPGGWFRMSGPEGMGKSALLDQVLLELRRQDLQTVTVDFTLMGNGTFKDLRSLLKRFCLEVGRALALPNAMAEYWDEECDLLQNATAYFEKYLLSDRTSPVVLVLDDVDQVFEHSDIRDDFCKLLVGWHRKAISGRSNRRGKVWSLLRVIIIHSTEAYWDWDIAYSPLEGVGKVAKLSDFSWPQIQQMLGFFGLTLTDPELQPLIDLVGGHPSLLTLAFEYLRDMNLRDMDVQDTGQSVEPLVAIAPSNEEPFGNHLRQKFGVLRQSPELWDGFSQVVTGESPVMLSNSVAYRLERMGLVRFEQNACVNRYEMYRRYFLNQRDGV